MGEERIYQKWYSLHKGATTAIVGIGSCKLPGLLWKDHPKFTLVRLACVERDIHKVLAQRFQQLGSLLGRFQRPRSRCQVV